MSKLFTNRSLTVVAGAAFQLRHYRAAKNAILRYERPIDTMKRYLFGAGSYPASVRVKTPLGWIESVLYSHHDMLTMNEIFCREDYRCPADSKTIVDFGSNIGISALYFLTRNKNAFAYLFEPLPCNAERLRKNLRGFEDRYEFSSVAVALKNGEAEFGYEETGRYGGIGVAHQKSIRVPCRATNGILKEVVDRHGGIDILKMDIESLEKEILLSVPIDLLRCIKNVFMEVEPMFETNPLPLTHTYRRYGKVARFQRRRTEYSAGKI